MQNSGKSCFLWMSVNGPCINLCTNKRTHKTRHGHCHGSFRLCSCRSRLRRQESLQSNRQRLVMSADCPNCPMSLSSWLRLCRWKGSLSADPAAGFKSQGLSCPLVISEVSFSQHWPQIIVASNKSLLPACAGDLGCDGTKPWMAGSKSWRKSITQTGQWTTKPPSWGSLHPIRFGFQGAIRNTSFSTWSIT